MFCAGTCRDGQGLPLPLCGQLLPPVQVWLLGRKERSQGKSGPGYSRNSKEAELLELREGQKGEGVSYGMRSSKPQQGRLKPPSSRDRKVLKDLELRNGEM